MTPAQWEVAAMVVAAAATTVLAVFAAVQIRIQSIASKSERKAARVQARFHALAAARSMFKAAEDLRSLVGTQVDQSEWRVTCRGISVSLDRVQRELEKLAVPAAKHGAKLDDVFQPFFDAANEVNELADWAHGATDVCERGDRAASALRGSAERLTSEYDL